MKKKPKRKDLVGCDGAVCDEPGCKKVATTALLGDDCSVDLACDDHVFKFYNPNRNFDKVIISLKLAKELAEIVNKEEV